MATRESERTATGLASRVETGQKISGRVKRPDAMERVDEIPARLEFTIDSIWLSGSTRFGWSPRVPGNHKLGGQILLVRMCIAVAKLTKRTGR